MRDNVSCLFLGVYTYDVITYIYNYIKIMQYATIILDRLWYKW